MSGFNTSLLHDGVDDYPNGATLVPIYQSSAFKHESAEELERIFDNKAMGFSYTRINNPTIEAFEKRITKLEKGFSSVACSSGMAAIFNSIANIVRQGDEVVASCGLYGGTVELFEDLESFGITVKYVADNKPECFEELITDKTRVVFAETIGNPKLDVTDIKAVADVAHAHGIPLIVDNTVSTPYLIQPVTLGADVVVNSSSKYINGSSDAISGILTFNGKFKFDKEKYPGLKPYLKFGPMAYIIKLRNGLFQVEGPKAVLVPAISGNNKYQFRFDDKVLGEHTNGENNSWNNGNITGSDHRARNFTMSAWVKTVSTNGQVMGHGQAPYYGAVGTFGVVLENGVLKMKARAWKDKGNCPGIAEVTTNATLTADEWAFITVTVDDTNKEIKLYKNGNKIEKRH